MDKEKLEKLQKMIDESKNIVFFGGAGVSTESGIPDFRSVDGLYNQKYDYPPETMLSHTFFVNKTEEFYRFYFDKLIIGEIKPNPAHYKLAELEAKGKLSAVITQNIDGLHQKAGSKVVYELHGGVSRNYCTSCGKLFGLDFMYEQKEKKSLYPVCDKCGGLVKPDVVLYEEPLDDNIMANSIKAIAKADMLIIGGTSLVVYPAAGLVNYYKGNKLVLINKTETSQDSKADLKITDAIGSIFEKIKV